MKRILFLIFLFTSTLAKAQNLVPNPSFEEYDNCPIVAGALPDAWEPTTYATGWHKPGAGSSDYFNACALSGGLGVPNNFFGHQEARTGDAYVGGYFDSESPYLVREYVHRQLSSTLIAGHTYYVRFWVSLSVVNTEFSNIYGINQIGAYFTEDYLDEGVTYVIEGPAQVQPSPEEAYINTLGWQSVSGAFTAEGNENWITLGRFMSPGTLITDTVVVATTPVSLGGCAYYFVDDVCVVDMAGEPEDIQVHELAICDTTETIIAGRSEVDNYIWDDGSTAETRIISAYGTYWVKSVDYTNCKLVIDTFHLYPGKPVEDFAIQGDTVWCEAVKTILKPAPLSDGAYRWHDNTYADSCIVAGSGTFWLEVKNGCFSKSDTIIITSFAPGSIQNGDSLFCLGSEIELIATGDDENNYLWYPDLGIEEPYSKNTVLRIIEEVTYYLTSSRGNCSAIDSLQISIVEPPLVVLPEDTVLCKNEGLAITHQNLLNKVAYLWSTGRYFLLH